MAGLLEFEGIGIALRTALAGDVLHTVGLVGDGSTAVLQRDLIESGGNAHQGLGALLELDDDVIEVSRFHGAGHRRFGAAGDVRGDQAGCAGGIRAGGDDLSQSCLCFASVFVHLPF